METHEHISCLDSLYILLHYPLLLECPVEFPMAGMKSGISAGGMSPHSRTFFVLWKWQELGKRGINYSHSLLSSDTSFMVTYLTSSLLYKGHGLRSRGSSCFEYMPFLSEFSSRWLWKSPIGRERLLVTLLKQSRIYRLHTIITLTLFHLIPFKMGTVGAEGVA